MPISADVELADHVTIHHPDLVNLYSCRVGAESRIGAFVEIQKGARVGSRCKISSHSFLCEGVLVEDDVFIGHGVMFTNDVYPMAVNADGVPQTDADWSVTRTIVRHGASIGSNATIIAGVEIGAGAMVGAGAVVTHDVLPRAIVAGVPARQIGNIDARRSVVAATSSPDRVTDPRREAARSATSSEWLYWAKDSEGQA